ncbi:ComEC/Rec2 family competence protein [uncultured Chryseobacterium sp.]
MPFEIDMLNVGNADAIILRYLDAGDREYIVVIDAGKTEEHGKMVVDHINKHTNKKSIDLAISTHPDTDHIRGFFYIIEHMIIQEFWIHDPKLHKIDESEIKSFFDTDYFEKGLKYVVESLNFSKDLIAIIDEKQIDRKQPLEGRSHPNIPIKVLGPSPEYYKEKLNSFRDIHLLYESIVIEKAVSDNLNLEDRANEFDRLIDRSNENNSSTILLFSGDNKKVLFTSDAGPEAILPVIEKYDLKNLDFLDVPHHGSKNNLNTAIMSRLNPGTAYISCGGSNPDQYIVDYLKLKGTRVFATNFNGRLRHSFNMPGRKGWYPVIPL